MAKNDKSTFDSNPDSTPAGDAQQRSERRTHLLKTSREGESTRQSSSSKLFESEGFLDLRAFRFAILQTVSEVLVSNPLGDPTRRRHGVLIPREAAPQDGWPVVFVLAGFTGNGPNYFNLKTFESNFAQTLDEAVSQREAPRAIYVFIEAMTRWGGSQFINSRETGRYEDFLLDEVVPAIREHLPVSREASRWCVMGGSSGGYGALHLASKAPALFGCAAAIAPDSFFEASLIPEFWSAAPAILQMGGIKGVEAELTSGKLQRRKDWHSILNAVAMALCYGADRDKLFPIDLQTGLVDADRFQNLKAHDPIVFLKARAENVAKLSGIFLDVGTRDQFHLQFGARQIRDVLKSQCAPLSYSEFEGNHFEIGDRRPQVWRWLLEQMGWQP